MAEDSNGLLVQITRCPIAGRCLAGERLKCADIVNSQRVAPDDFHVPEPWSGHIAQAPILFVSSNPSIDRTADYPTAGWADERRADYFGCRFDQHRPLPWIDNRMRFLLATSPPRHSDRSVAFWSATRNRASEMLGRQAVPGRDFALTEVVHCKSVREFGVEDALDTCVATWLHPVIGASAARVIVLFGRRAQTAFHHAYGIPARSAMTGPREVEGIARIVLQLPHPNQRGSEKRNCAPLTQVQLDQVSRFLDQ